MEKKERLGPNPAATDRFPESSGPTALRCDVCGSFGAFALGDRVLCRDCYSGAGSCCPEFGKDDLWEVED